MQKMAQKRKSKMNSRKYPPRERGTRKLLRSKTQQRKGSLRLMISISLLQNRFLEDVVVKGVEEVVEVGTRSPRILIKLQRS